MKKFIQKIKSIFNKQKLCIYYIDGEKIISDYSNKIPLYDISSPDENTPALEDLTTGFKFWCEKGRIYHRLTGPAIIYSDGSEYFFLNDEPYENVKNWLKDHPNPDLYFDAIGLNETERVLWFLQK
jgi:hypothetical protein